MVALGFELVVLKLGDFHLEVVRYIRWFHIKWCHKHVDLLLFHFSHHEIVQTTGLVLHIHQDILLLRQAFALEEEESANCCQFSTDFATATTSLQMPSHVRAES